VGRRWKVSKSALVQWLTTGKKLKQNPPAGRRGGKWVKTVLAKSIAQSSVFDNAKNVAIEMVCERYLNLTLRLSGRNLVAKCPFHEDRRPSFVVWPASGRWKCFGCGAAGGAVAGGAYPCPAPTLGG